MNKLLDCGHEPSVTSGIDTGYGINKNGKKFCYSCIAGIELEECKQKDKHVFYLSKEANSYIVSNWPGSIKIKPDYVKSGKHNFAGSQKYVWFNFAGKRWLGRQIGDNNDLLHCKAIKRN